MLEDEEKTRFAAKAVHLATAFNSTLGAKPWSLGASYRLELSVPEGRSTGGGVQSVQHVKLISVQGDLVVVIASVDQIRRHAELKSHDHLAHAHSHRFKGEKLPLDRLGYIDLLHRLHAFFLSQTYKVDITEPPTSLHEEPTAEMPRELDWGAFSSPWVLRFTAWARQASTMTWVLFGLGAAALVVFSVLLMSSGA